MGAARMSDGCARCRVRWPRPRHCSLYIRARLDDDGVNARQRQPPQPRLQCRQLLVKDLIFGRPWGTVLDEEAR